MDWTRLLELGGLGLVASTWGALIGAGGGFIMVPVLLLLDKSLNAAAVTAVSLAAVFVSGISGTIAYARLRRIDYRSGALFLVCTLPGGVIGALLVNRIERGVFQASFGILLIGVASYVSLRPRRPLRTRVLSQGSSRRLVDVRKTVYEYRVNLQGGAGITLVEGFLASMLGVGGGILNVPVFVFLLGMPIHVATATSQFMVMGTSAAATMTNLLEGDLWGLWPTVISLMVGTVVGAQIGPRLSQRLSGPLVARILALGLMIVGLRLAYAGISTF